MSNNKLPLWLFVAYGGGHVKALLPVAKLVKSLGLADPVFLALTTAGPIVRASNIPAIGFNDFLDPEDIFALEIGKKLVSFLSIQATDYDESVAYLGLSYLDLIDRHGEDGAKKLYAEYGRQVFLPLTVMQKIFKRLSPALLIATNSPRAEQAAIETAVKMSIPSVCLVDLFGVTESDRLSLPNYADAVCVLNENVRQMLILHGRNSEQIYVTGNPAFDEIFSTSFVEDGVALRQNLGWNDLHVCLLATSPEPDRYPGLVKRGDPLFPRQIEAAMIEAVNRNPNLALLVRRHPSEEAADDVANLKHPRIQVSNSNTPLHTALNACDEVIVTISTVGVEASLLGKLVVKVSGSVSDHLCRLVQFGFASKSIKRDELVKEYTLPIEQRVFPEKNDSPLNFKHSNNVSSASKVVEVLKKIASKNIV